MRVTLINPQTLIQPDDPLTTGIYYFPITLASLAATLREQGHGVRVVDTFGEAPRTVRRWQSWWIQGLPIESALERVGQDPGDAIFVYAGNLVSHEATLELLRGVSRRWPEKPRIAVENTQAVTAYALKKVLPDFFEAGATHVLTGECELRAGRLLAALSGGESAASVDGVYWQTGRETGGTEPAGVITDLDALPFPAWDLFPLENYW